MFVALAHQPREVRPAELDVGLVDHDQARRAVGARRSATASSPVGLCGRARPRSGGAPSGRSWTSSAAGQPGGAAVVRRSRAGARTRRSPGREREQRAQEQRLVGARRRHDLVGREAGVRGDRLAQPQCRSRPGSDWTGNARQPGERAGVPAGGVGGVFMSKPDQRAPSGAAPPASGRRERRAARAGSASIALTGSGARSAGRGATGRRPPRSGPEQLHHLPRVDHRVHGVHAGRARAAARSASRAPAAGRRSRRATRPARSASGSAGRGRRSRSRITVASSLGDRAAGARRGRAGPAARPRDSSTVAIGAQPVLAQRLAARDEVDDGLGGVQPRRQLDRAVDRRPPRRRCRARRRTRRVVAG